MTKALADDDSPFMKTAEMAAHLRCSEWLVKKLARTHKDVGFKLPGAAGWRFTEADVERLRLILAPAPPVERRRRRRSA
jgi:hypothetical protein